MKKSLQIKILIFASIFLAVGTNSLFADSNPSISSKISQTLIDTEANKMTQNLYHYLQDQYGKKIISGQMENAWNDNCNMLGRVYEDTGKYPALMGFDFMNYTRVGWPVKNLQTERAIQFWQGKDWNGKQIAEGKHGIVAFTWHWRDPNCPSSKTGEFYTEKADFRIPYDIKAGKWDTESKSYKNMMADMAIIAGQLKRLEEAGVPVLWRPIHEACGNVGNFPGGKAWFWWGAGPANVKNPNANQCAQAYIALWKLMFDYFTNEKGIHNLIWVWNAQNPDWYPGNEYVDIISDDIYFDNERTYSKKETSDYPSQVSTFKKYVDYADPAGTKIVALSENGKIPSPENMAKDGAWWSWFMVWNDGEIVGNDVSRNGSQNNFWSGNFHNNEAHKKAVYESPYVVTLDKLPDLTRY